MKTYKNLFEKICELENIKLAILNAANGKKHKHIVQFALNNADKIALDIQQQLITGTWKPPKYHQAHFINDGIENKKRPIICPEFIKEQIVHHAIMQVVYPIFNRKFYEFSCGSIKGRGVQTVIKHIEKHIKDQRFYCKLDIEKFYQTVRPSFVFRELRRTIADKRVLLMFSKILRSNTIKIGNETFRHGLPIGLYTSPFFANVLLNRLDHTSKNRFGLNVYVRYMDDICILDTNKRKIKQAIGYIQTFIGVRKLKLKQAPQIHHIRKFSFCGYKLNETQTTLKSKLYLKCSRNFQRFITKSKTTIYDCQRLLSYAGYVKHTTSGKLLSIIQPFIRQSRQRISNLARAITQ